ncbi:probable G-protein coupled receptor 88 [Carlito syrichta]|uniref:Probable G-protein coupled receptor 88 n=1 Tax=Carlito syrichta TaxID=1868482 RepID=A0A3Q0EB40_CARSF|nr:probable G-protein coupled receptor 88 [Carlito syrichta]
MTNSSSASASSAPGGSPLLLCEEEESWAGRRIPVSLLYSGLAIGGTLANGMVIYLVSSFRKLQTTSNAFIVNGCAADLSVCALWMPQEAVLGLLPAGAAEPPAGWDGAGGSYRLLRGGLLGLGLTVSLLSHCLVALNRYLLITRASSSTGCSVWARPLPPTPPAGTQTQTPSSTGFPAQAEPPPDPRGDLNQGIALNGVPGLGGASVSDPLRDPNPDLALNGVLSPGEASASNLRGDPNPGLTLVWAPGQGRASASDPRREPNPGLAQNPAPRPSGSAAWLSPSVSVS